MRKRPASSFSARGVREAACVRAALQMEVTDPDHLTASCRLSGTFSQCGFLGGSSASPGMSDPVHREGCGGVDVPSGSHELGRQLHKAGEHGVSFPCSTSPTAECDCFPRGPTEQGHRVHVRVQKGGEKGGAPAPRPPPTGAGAVAGA